MQVDLIDHMGSDLTVVNSARVSFNKNHSHLDSSDERLILYLAEHNHWSPFAHCQVQFRFKAPIFVARQLVKHQVGMVWNEVSRRYVDTPVELYWPTKWRKKAANVKQGSSNEEWTSPVIEKRVKDCLSNAQYLYQLMLDSDVCPEQARMILPQNAYTEWYWTGSLVAWARVFNQRTSSTAQQETRKVVQHIDEHLQTLFPLSWAALTDRSEL